MSWYLLLSFLTGFVNFFSGQSLKEATTLFTRSLTECRHDFSEENLKALIDYVFSNFFQHYKLYQYVLTKDRDEDRTKIHLVVEPPAGSVPPFSEGIPKTEWDEKERLKQIDGEEQRRNKVQKIISLYLSDALQF